MNRFSVITINTLLVFSGLFYGCNRGQSATLDVQTTPVRVVEAKPAQLQQAIAYSGTIEPKQSVALSFSVNGTVKQVLAAEGDFVRKGQPLAVLNDITLRNANQMAHATLNQARDAYDRLKPMFDNGNLPEIRFIEARTGLQQAQAAAAISDKNLNDCTLYAPRAGFIGRRSVEAGQNILPGIAVFTLVNIDVVTARIQVAEGEISAMQTALPAEVQVAALQGKKINGTVRNVGVVADPVAHTYTVKIEVANPQHLLKPGMISEVKIDLPTTGSGLVVPNRAVQVDENGCNFIFSVPQNANQAQRHVVKTGRLLDSGIEIISGLNSGDRVVVSGLQKLIPGAAVEIMHN